MSKESFINNLSDETVIKMIDKTYRYEKNKKDKGIKRNLLKIIPAVAAIALVIGLATLLPNIITNNIARDDVKVISVDATNIASKAGNVKGQNMAMLGGLMKATELFTIDNVKQVLERAFKGKDPGLISLNLAAVQAGMS